MGEYIAAAIIEGLGWKTSLAPMEDIDLLAFQDNRFLRVQVKSALPTMSAGSKTPSYTYKPINKGVLPVGKADIYVFVAIDLRKAIFVNAKDITKTMRRYRIIDFAEIGIEASSWDDAICGIFG